MANGDSEQAAAAKKEEEPKKKGNSVVRGIEITSSARNPLDRMVDIAKDPDLTDEDKIELILYARNNFKNRRKMAYICLLTIVVSLALLFVAAFIDGIRTDTKILAAIKDIQGIVASIQGFLTAIVGAYYGVSAWRPSS